MKHHVTAYHVDDGISERALADLTAAQRRVVVKLLARVSERSYRRGAQQGITFQRNRPHTLPDDIGLHDWRYGTSTDEAPWLDMRHVESAMERLFVENPGLRRLGLQEEDQ